MPPKAASPKAALVKAPRISASKARGLNLDFRGLNLGDRAFVEALLECRHEVLDRRQADHFEQVYFADINIQNNSITGAGVKSLLDFCEALEIRPRLLRLDHNSIADDGLLLITTFIQNMGTPMEQLHLSHNKFTERGVDPLLRAIGRHGAYPRTGPHGDFIPLWLRLEHNRIRDVEGVFAAARRNGCTYCKVSGYSSDCSVTRCERSECQHDHTPKVHLVHLESQDVTLAKSPTASTGSDSYTVKIEPRAPVHETVYRKCDIPLDADGYRLCVTKASRMSIQREENRFAALRKNSAEVIDDRTPKEATLADFMLAKPKKELRVVEGGNCAEDTDERTPKEATLADFMVAKPMKGRRARQTNDSMEMRDLEKALKASLELEDALKASREERRAQEQEKQRQEKEAADAKQAAEAAKQAAERKAAEERERAARVEQEQLMRALLLKADLEKKNLGVRTLALAPKKAPEVSGAHEEPPEVIDWPEVSGAHEEAGDWQQYFVQPGFDSYTIFESPHSFTVIGMLQIGDCVLATREPEEVDGYQMVMLKQGGAVDMSILSEEVQQPEAEPSKTQTKKKAKKRGAAKKR